MIKSPTDEREMTERQTRLASGKDTGQKRDYKRTILKNSKKLTF